MRQRDLTPPNSNGYRRNVKEKIKLTKIKTRNYERETPIRAKKIKTLRSTRGINAVSLWPSLVFRVRQQLTKTIPTGDLRRGKKSRFFSADRSRRSFHHLLARLKRVSPDCRWGRRKLSWQLTNSKRIHYVCRVDDINAQLNVCCRYTVPGL